jgi:two-component system sensor histidine kinase DegS
LEIQASLGRAAELALHEEHARLARDLHDGLAQDLASLLLRADLCQTLADPGSVDLRANLEAISTGIQHCIRDARATIFALQSAEQEACSLEDGLRAAAVRFEGQTRVPVDFSMIGADCQQLRHEHELALLHLAQEALTNIRKHARAKRVSVQLTWLGSGQVQLCVSDDGRGFDAGIIARAEGIGGQHLGLAFMREQVEMLGGILSVKSGADEGTTVCAVLPLRRGAGRHGQDPRSDRR